MKDYFVKKKFSLKRFGIELSILLFFLDSLYFYLTNNTDIIFIGILFFLFFSLFASLFNEKLLIPFHKLFLVIFVIISKVTNPILIIFCYVVGILPFGIFYKFYSFFFKSLKNNNDLTYWKKAELSTQKIQLDEQY